MVMHRSTRCFDCGSRYTIGQWPNAHAVCEACSPDREGYTLRQVWCRDEAPYVVYGERSSPRTEPS